jgi:hypothetical protein
LLAGTTAIAASLVTRLVSAIVANVLPIRPRPHPRR